MNDYWNDPPDPPEPPPCPNDKGDKCEGYGEYLYDGKTGMVMSCDTCGYQWVIPFERDPEPEMDLPTEEDMVAGVEPYVCPHGKTESCSACDHLSDLAYDAAREDRMFGRWK